MRIQWGEGLQRFEPRRRRFENTAMTSFWFPPLRRHQLVLYDTLQPKFVWISFAPLASLAVKKFRTQPENRIINR